MTAAVKGILYVAGGILLLFFVLVGILSALDFTVRVRYINGELTLSAGVRPVLIPVFPQKEKPETGKKPSASKKKQARKKAARKTKEQLDRHPEDLPGTVSAVKELLTAFFPPAARALRHIRVRGLTIHIRVGGPDAAETAIRYGRTNALLYGGLGAFSNAVDIRARHVGVSYDFLARETITRFEADFRLRGGHILDSLFSGLAGYMKIQLKKPAGEPAEQQPFERKG